MGMPMVRYSFTVDEYHRMADAGLFGEDDRIELLDGQIIEMSPIGPRHAGCVDRLTLLLVRAVGDSAIVRVQNPVIVDLRGEPQPDLALLRPPMARYAREHPRPEDILLLIEVADSSVDYDRDVKMPIYARTGIVESWLVNLPADRVEQYSEPGPNGYATVRTFGRGERITPAQLPGVALPVDEILM